jgi:DNA recombination protein Rad52
MFNDEQKKALAAPLSRSHVKNRTQSGRSFSYIEGWHSIAEANRIFGYDGWNRETFETRCVSEKPRKVGRDLRDGYSVSYVVRCRITVGNIMRDGTGAGHGIDVDLGLAHESAIKEAETDAMKRALMTFGNPFGLALYDKEQKEVVETEDNIHSILDAQIEIIKTFKTEAAINKWWKQTNELRNNFGIIKGTPEYDVLVGAAQMQMTIIRGEQNG